MRLFLFVIGFILFGTWMNLVFNNYFQILGLKINWLLVFMLVLSFRYSKNLLSFLGIFAGLICDALSHGIMGLYGTSFLLTLLLVNQLKRVFYSNTFFSISLAVSGLSILEGWISISILGLFETNIEQSALLLKRIFPLAIMHGFVTPIILQLVIWGENFFLKDVT